MTRNRILAACVAIVAVGAVAVAAWAALLHQSQHTTGPFSVAVSEGAVAEKWHSTLDQPDPGWASCTATLEVDATAWCRIKVTKVAPGPASIGVAIEGYDGDPALAEHLMIRAGWSSGAQTCPASGQTASIFMDAPLTSFPSGSGSPTASWLDAGGSRTVCLGVTYSGGAVYGEAGGFAEVSNIALRVEVEQ